MTSQASSGRSPPRRRAPARGAWAALALALAASAALSALAPATMGKAPVFELRTTGLEAGGVPKPMRLADHRGSVVVLDFMAVGCVACRDVTDEVLRPLMARHPDVRVLSIDVWSDPVFMAGGETEADLVALQQAEGTLWPHARDTAKVHEAYGVTGLPRLVVVDPRGHIVLARDGVPSLATVERAVQSAQDRA